VHIHNAALALAVMSELGLVSLSTDTVQNTLRDTTLIGRFQQVHCRPDVYADVAHNPHSAGYLAERLTALRPQYQRIIAVVGMLANKDHKNTLLPLLALVDEWITVTTSEPNRRYHGQALAEQLYTMGAHAVSIEQAPEQGYRTALSTASPNDLVIVVGSFCTVAPILNSMVKAP